MHRENAMKNELRPTRVLSRANARLAPWLTVILLLPCLTSSAHAQEAHEGHTSSTTNYVLQAQPNRPSSSNAAEVLDPGVLQVEYGFSREWGAEGDRLTELGGELRFGLWRNIEVRWGGSPLVNLSLDAAHARGFGDQYLSGQYQFLRQSEGRPALALSYAVKFPTADSAQSLGSGRVDHNWLFLVSKDIHHFTWDFNAGYQLIGRPNSTGFDQNGLLILTFQRQLAGPLSVIGEIGGQSRLGDQAPAYATTLWALTYSLHPRVVVDAAIETGITNGAPHKKILFGVTYAIANLYRRP